jgi:diguanylate cyclase (GGDEF)-like protein
MQTEGTFYMDDSAQTQVETDSNAPRPPRWGPRALWVTFAALAVFGATDYFAAAFLRRDPLTLRLPLSVVTLVMVTLMLAAGAVAVHLRRHWSNPVTRLRKALEEAVEGQLLIEELNQPFGGLSPLCPVLRDLLRERRQQKSEIARLRAEIDQRVAKRTDVLERLISKLRAQATRDVLTGLFNRRVLDECLDELVQRCRQDRTPLCLLMIDVDDFKLLNDTLGHAAGDTLLRCIGQLIRSSVRQQDLAFRCGGDEFLIILPQCPKPQGEALARRLTDLVDALAKTLNVPRKPRLSIGVSMLSDLSATATAAELIKHADARLYAVKSARKQARGPDPRAA